MWVFTPPVENHWVVVYLVTLELSLVNSNQSSYCYIITHHKLSIKYVDSLTLIWTGLPRTSQRPLHAWRHTFRTDLHFASWWPPRIAALPPTQRLSPSNQSYHSAPLHEVRGGNVASAVRAESAFNETHLSVLFVGLINQLVEFLPKLNWI